MKNKNLEEYVSTLSPVARVELLLEQFDSLISQQDKQLLKDAMADVVEARLLCLEDIKAPPYHKELGLIYVQKLIRLNDLEGRVINVIQAKIRNYL